jgi:ERF superfamily
MNAPTTFEADTIHSAMARAFAQIEGATKSAANPHFKSKYADLTTVIDAIKPALVANGLFFTQCPTECSGGVQIKTFLHHQGGENLFLGELFVPANKNDAQAYGSALTYARRYALVTAFGVPVEDDDGNAASGKQAGQRGSDRTVSPPATITDSQWAELVQLVEVTGTDAGKLCLAYKADSLRDFTGEQFTAAKAILTKRLKEKADA